MSIVPFRARACRYPGSKLVRAQLEDPDNFENWEKLVRATETLEGGLNRNSSPQAIATTRDAYDRFLAKFPLLFGYWKKYADLEFSIAGTEAAEMVRLDWHSSRANCC
jgi:pre-mRNA-processing factor 39